MDTGETAGIVEQHQRQQTLIFRMVRKQFVQHAGEPDGLGAQIQPQQLVARCGGVAFVEDQVNHGLHGREALRQLGRRRDLIGNARLLDLALGPHQPLRERRLRHEKCLRDLGGGEAAQSPQRQRHLPLRIQRRMAACEDQPQAIVGKMHGQLIGSEFHRVGEGFGFVAERILLFPLGFFAPALIDQLAVRGSRDPRGRIQWNAARRPRDQGRGKCFLHGLLGTVERSGDADQRSDDAAGLLAEDSFHRRSGIHR